MARHYIKVPASIRDYFPGGAPANWREAIVADATDGGKRITIEPMLANDRGPRITVHGDRYVFWFGRDDFRSDTLFVMRMEPAKDPRQQVHDYFGRFELWPGGNPAGADSVAGLFDEEEAPEVDVPDEADAASPEPSPLLLKELTGIPQGLVRLFRPAAAVTPVENVPAAVDAFRRFWRRYRLKDRLEVAPRLESMLQLGVTPARLEPGEWRLLSGLFSFAALNAIALESPTPERLHQALTDLSDLPLDAHARTSLWTGLLRTMAASDLRRELHEAAPVMLEAASEGIESERLLEDGVIAALREVSLRESDGTLEEMAGAGALAEDPLAHVALWAQSLDFRAVEQEPALEPAVPAEPVSVPVERPGIERWIAQIAFPDRDDLGQLMSVTAETSSSIYLSASNERSDAIQASLEAMHVLAARLQAALSLFPKPAEVAELAQQARTVAADASSLLGESEAERLLNGCGPSVEDLRTILHLVQAREDLERAPAWLIWPDEDPPFELPSASLLDLAVLLGEPERRGRCQRFLDYLRQIGEPGTVRWLRPPVAGASIEDALQEWVEGTRAFLEGLSPEDRASALADPGMSPELRQELLHLVSELTGRLSDTAGQWVRDTVDAQVPGARLRLVKTLTEEVVKFSRTMRLQASLVSIAMLETWATLPDESPSDAGVRVQHNWVGEKGARATLLQVQDDPSRDLAHFDVPLVLESDEPRECALRMQWDVKGDWRATWPAEYPSVEPEQLSVARYQWRRDEEGEPYQHTFRLRIPVRVSRDRRKRLEIAVTVEDASTGEVLVRDHLLRWETLQYDPVPISPVWSTAGRPDDVDKHPIGPQARAATILSRLSALSCTAIIAPRRFGKTTLVSYLANALPERGIYAAPAVVCTDHKLTKGIDYSALWSRVSNDLYSEFDTGLPGDWSGALPPDHAFDAVRRTAAKRGHKAIALLFDEAQLFFPSGDGHDVGSRLKTRLEGAWCAQRKGMVPVLFCFVGLPPFIERAGADLTGLLIPIEARGMTEEELRPLISSKVPALQTTRGIRTELARTAGNLFILRVLLNRLSEYVEREGRLWASLDDLTEVSRSLQRDLREGREESVAAYIRDVLNEADDVNVWSPSVSVPVAAALADVRAASTSFDDLMARAAERLNEWSRASFADARGRPIYDQESVRRHFAKLASLKVIGHTGEFASQYLAAWLSGLARRWTADEAFRAALFGGGQRRIHVPSGYDVVHESGDTRIFKVEDPHGALGYRLRTLKDEEDRTTFLDSSAMFDGLRAAVNQGEDGSRFVFRLEDVGLWAADPREAVQVYRWVEGNDLRSRIGCMAPEHVVDMGIKLGRALTMLHRRGILHRDIHPGNIVIDEGEHASDDLRPVLIDFGFARIVGHDMRTRLAGDFAAPEVSVNKPEWLRASDVYSLCATLRATLSPDAHDAGAILDVLQKGLVTAPASRPSAEALTLLLQRLAQTLMVQQRRDEAWVAIRGRLGQGAYSPELSATVNRHRTVLELLELGSYRKLDERHRVVADIVSQCTERRVVPGLKGVTLSTQSQAVAVLHALRVVHVHPETKLSQDHKRALSDYRAGSPAHQSAVVREALAAVSDYLKLPALKALLEVYV